MAVKRSIAYKFERLIPFIRREWRALACIALLTLVGAIATALIPWPLKILVDYALGEVGLPVVANSVLDFFRLSPTPLLLIVVASAASVGLFGLISAVEVAQIWLWSAAGHRIAYNLASALFRKLLHLPLISSNKRAVGDSLSRLTTDTWCVYPLVQALLIKPVQNLFTLLVIGSIAWQMEAGLTILALLISPILAVLAVLFGSRLRRRARLSREAQSSLMVFVHQVISVLPVVQAYGAEGRNKSRFKQLSNAAISRSQRSVLLRNSYGLINGLTVTVGAAFVLYVGGQRVIAGALSVGSLLVFVAYARSLQHAVESLLNAYGDLKTAEASMDRVLEVLDADQETQDTQETDVVPAHSVKKFAHIAFEHVFFGYVPGNYVLHDVNFEAQPGETIALVGPTGVGKTTAVSLVPRFFEPSHGRVTLNGIDIREIPLTSLRSQVSMALQDPFLFPLTVAENISYGRPGASRAEIISAAVSANADEFIRDLPRGYDTPMSERGATISGGQKQRLSIARALLRDTPILILDEPTSALDPETEKLLLQALRRLAQGRTTFIIAHRLSTIRNADLIVVLEHGTVAEIGTHRELIASNGSYMRFHALQSGEPVGEVVA